MATVYHRDDTGAPVYAFSTSTVNSAHFNALKVILKACLVSGYGSKPAAGWELVAEGDLYLVLRNGSHSGYVCVSRPTASANYVDIWLAETFTGVVNNVMTGAGLKSGTAASNGSPQRLYIGLLAYSSASSSWYVVADDRTFVFQGGGNNSEYSDSGSNARIPLYVGEDSQGWFISVGGQNTASTGVSSLFDASALTTLRYPESGLLVDVGSIEALTPELTVPGNASSSAVFALGGAYMCPVVWGSTQALAGKLRGIAVCPALLLRHQSPAAQCLGHVGPLTARNFNTPLPLGDGRSWFMGLNNLASATRLVTDHPEFW